MSERRILFNRRERVPLVKSTEIKSLNYTKQHAASNEIVFDGENYDEWEDNLFNHLKSKNIYKAIKDARPTEIKLIKGEVGNALKGRKD